MDLLSIAQTKIPDLKKKTAKEWAGPCPRCGGEDRFVVWVDRWHCRGCERSGEAVSSGDAIAFLREFENMSCPEAHGALGLDCQSSGCPVFDKCPKGSGQHHRQQPKSVQPAAQKKEQTFTPSVAVPPEQRWQQQAAQLIAKAHTALLDCPEQLDYLASRGLPLEAIQKGQLGWLSEDHYPSRESWGLPEILKEDKKPKKMFIPAGILIPFFDNDRNPHRIRIRRSKVREGDARYFWLQGSGDDVPIIGGAGRRGVVVVESDLDGFMVRWQCRDLDVSVIPLGTCSAKPKQQAMASLQKALAILVALDIEPRLNSKTNQPENPGGQASNWWLKQFPRAQRWPVPAGKDPGEYYQDHNGDIRSWVLAGLPPAFHVPKYVGRPKPTLVIPGHIKGTSLNGHRYIIADKSSDIAELAKHYPDDVIFAPEEISALQGMSREEAEIMLLAKKTFAGSIEGTTSISVATKVDQGDLFE